MINRAKQLIQRINIKGLNTTIDTIIRPGALLKGSHDKYLSATNYFFSVTGFAFFLIVAKRQISLEQPTNYYYVPERLVSYLRMQDNFNDEYGFYIPFMVVIPLSALILSLLFRHYSVKEIFSLVLYFFGTCTIYVTIYLGLFPGGWFLPATLIVYAAYYAGVTLYGKVWVRLLKTAVAAVLTALLMATIPFQRIVQYAYYQALHQDKIMFATPDPEVVPSKILIEDYSENNDGTHLEDIGDQRLFTTSIGQKQKLHLFDSAMLRSDTITVDGRLIHIEVLNSDSLAVITAIKGKRDSSEYALITFLDRANLQLIGSYQLPTEYYTINDALWNQSLWISGAQLTDKKIIIPSITELQLHQDSIQTIETIQLSHLDNARGYQIALFKDQAFISTYKKEENYLYDLSIHSLNPPDSYQLFEKRTQFSPSPFHAASLMSINDLDGTIVTSRSTNDHITTFPVITIFPKGDLANAIFVKTPIVADEFLTKDLMFQNEEIHLCGLVNYLITSDFRSSDSQRYGIYLRINKEGEVLDQQIFAPDADHNFEPIKFLNITDNSVSILGREHWYVPIIGQKQNLTEARLAIGNSRKESE